MVSSPQVWFVSLCVSLLHGAARSAPPPAPSVTAVACPARDCLVPDVHLDSSGRLHAVWGTSDKQAYYAVSADGAGAAWSPPVRLNGPQNVTTTMGERGPKLSGSPDGRTLAVFWADLWFPGAVTFPRFALSRDGGASWSAPALAAGRPAVDGLSGAVDASGALLVAFHSMDAGAPKPANASEATWLFVAASPDGGATWTTAANGTRVALPAAHGGGVACSMCGTRVRALGGGRFALAMRSAENNVRDHQLVVGAVADGFASATAATAPVAAPWVYPACPMNGPELVLGSGGAGPAATLAFMSTDANSVFWAGWSGTAWTTGAVPTPRGDTNARYPTAVANAAGDVLLVWQVGPMAVAGTAAVKYALYSAAGEPQGAEVTLGSTFAGTKATAWARGGDFFVMTSPLQQQKGAPRAGAARGSV